MTTDPDAAALASSATPATFPFGNAEAGRLEAPEFVPISLLNALVYCPRRFYYEYAWGEMLINEHVLEGTVRHETADAGGREIDDTTLRMRRVYVYSERLHISGFIDVVEGRLEPAHEADPAMMAAVETPEEKSSAKEADLKNRPDEARLYPIEYKKGSARGGGLHDHVQLCAQGLCLEERLGATIAGGYVFSFQSRHRIWIPFTPALRAQTEAAVIQAFALLRAGHLPPPLPAEQARKCRECSLEPLCLPREVQVLKGVAPLTRRHSPRR
jgi:CRISPR-associated exonuclease Cas4